MNNNNLQECITFRTPFNTNECVTIHTSPIPLSEPIVISNTSKFFRQAQLSVNDPINMEKQTVDTSKNSLCYENQDLINYKIIILNIITEIVDNKEANKFVSLRVICAEKRTDMEIPYNNFSKIHKQIKRIVPYITINTDILKAPDILDNEISVLLPNASEVYRIKQNGWFCDKNGKFIFAYNNRTDTANYKFQTGTTRLLNNNPFISMQKENALFKNIPNVSGPLLLYAFSGILYNFFEYCNYPHQFLLFISGRTGSFKTSIAKVLFPNLNSSHEILRFFDTPASLEVALKDSRSTVTLIDDFSPPTTPDDKKLMNKNLELITRIAGDNNGKKRSNINFEKVNVCTPDESIVMTGEFIRGELSSNLRTLHVEITDNIDLEVLSELQKEETIIKSDLIRFALFIEEHQDTIINIIKNYYPKYRTNCKVNFKYQRHASILAELFTICDILKYYFISNHYATNEDADIFFEQLRSNTYNILQQNNNDSMESINNDTIYAETLYKCIISNCNLFASNKEAYEANLPIYLGFRDQSFIYVNGDKMYKLIKDYLQNIDFHLCDSIAVCHKKLFKLNLLQRRKNGGTNYTFYMKVKLQTGFQSMLKIDFDKLESLCSKN